MANKELKFYEAQTKLCLVVTEAEALVSVANSHYFLIHYPFLDTRKERLKVIHLKSISAQSAIFTVSFALVGLAFHQA